MRKLLIIALAFAGTDVLASQPGQPLDCSDWVFLEPGFICDYVETSTPSFFSAPTAVVENSGTVLYVRAKDMTPPPECAGPGLFLRHEIVRETVGGEAAVLAYLEDRCADGGATDKAEMFWSAFDEENGALILRMSSHCGTATPCLPDYATNWYARIEGFTTTFEILQTYTPDQTAFVFRVPSMPEGFERADRFDTYVGPLNNPARFELAQPLKCDYPAEVPETGDLLLVADTVPAPPPGLGVYYVTAVSHQGDSRVGRKTNHGRLIGRDPATLPACVME